ncbi:MAG: hypothetical protein JST25_03085, partial [Actinobacteria bacterium]|nr:hypothetical protein [Actinomycetota bacterium]
GEGDEADDSALQEAAAASTAATRKVVQTVIDELVAAAGALRTALDAGTPGTDFSATAALEVFHAAGLAGTAQESDDDVIGLARRCIAAADAATARWAQLDATPEPDHPLIAGRPGAGDATEQAERITAAVRDIFGETTVVAPALSAHGLSLSTAAAEPTMPGGDALADWLGELSEVRGATRRWWAATLATEALTGRAPALIPTQLPRDAGDWIGGFAGPPVRWSAPFGARRAFVAHAPVPLQGDAVCGLVVESWVEQVPVAFETDPHRLAEADQQAGPYLEPTGVAVHYNAPGARPPQSILLAVPPDRSAASWSMEDLVATVLETLELARFRGIEPPKDLPSRAVIPAVFVPEGIEGVTFASTLMATVGSIDLTLGAMHARRFGDG